MISFALLAAPKDVFWERLSSDGQQWLIIWLSGMHDKEMSQANWLWFRVFTNLALLKICGVDTQEIREQMQSDLIRLDSFYMTDGWSSDGLWRSADMDDKKYKIYQSTGRANGVEQSRNADYYSGSFAIQFSQLLYVRFASDLDPARSERYCQQAREFGRGFSRFFDSQGKTQAKVESKFLWPSSNTCRCRYPLWSFSHLSLRLRGIPRSTGSGRRTRYA